MNIHEHMAEFHHGDGYEDIKEPAQGYTAALHAQVTHDGDHEILQGLRRPHIHDNGKVISHPKDMT